MSRYVFVKQAYGYDLSEQMGQVDQVRKAGGEPPMDEGEIREAVLLSLASFDPRDKPGDPAYDVEITIYDTTPEELAEEVQGLIDEDDGCIEALDMLVHDVASSTASDTNNSGVGRQIWWLMERGMSPRAIREALAMEEPE